MIHRGARETGSETDRGSITPVSIFGLVVTLALALTLSNATALLNQQRFLESVAQAIALDAAGNQLVDQQSPISITDDTSQLLLDLSVQSSLLSSRLSGAKVTSGIQNIDGSVAIKICQPPRILFMNQVVPLAIGLEGQVCASAAAIRR